MVWNSFKKVFWIGFGENLGVCIGIGLIRKNEILFSGGRDKKVVQGGKVGGQFFFCQKHAIFLEINHIFS